MEEFLFGVSYEQILRLKGILRDQGVKSIGRDEVSSYLGERVKTDINLDYRDFYLLRNFIPLNLGNETFTNLCVRRHSF